MIAGFIKSSRDNTNRVSHLPYLFAPQIFVFNRPRLQRDHVVLRTGSTKECDLGHTFI